MTSIGFVDVCGFDDSATAHTIALHSSIAPGLF
jgi:hypothetical protein